MAVFIVSNTNDSGAGSLRAAILGANASSGEDSILFLSEVFLDNTPDTITLTSGQLTFTDSARTILVGQGADLLTISGNSMSRVFEVANGATAFLADVAIANGVVNGAGGGILNNGTLTLSYSQVTNNSAVFGGGIFNNEGTVVVENSTIYSNSTSLTGGAISNFAGTLDIRNSTVSSNSSTLLVGGIETLGTQPVTIRNSTITLNQGGGLDVENGASVQVWNTIIAGNNGFDISGTLGSGSSFNLIGGDPRLAPLTNNGGTTQTHALLPDSPARNAGSNALIPSGMVFDQRGFNFSRIISERVDIGAFEALPVVSLTPILTEQEEGTGGTTSYFYNIFLSAPTDVPVTVTLGITGGTASTDDFAVPVTFTLPPGSLGRVAVIEVNGDSTFEPDETFTYSIIGVTNATIAPNANSVTSTIVNDDLPPNRNPIALNDSVTVAAYESVNVNVLANDSDLDGDPLILSIVTNPTNGTAIANDNGTPSDRTDDFITYTPTPGYCGSDRFTYQIDDGKGGTAIATANLTVTGANLVGTSGNDNGIDNPALFGTNCTDTIDGKAGNDQITGKQGNDSLTGGGGQDQFIYTRSDGRDLITDFGGVGKTDNPSGVIRAEVDTLQFQGAGLTAPNLLLTQAAANLEITFEGTDTKVILQNFQLENLENVRRSNNTTSGLGNILFNGQTNIEDNFDVFDANSTRTSLLARNTVTFLNDRNNIVSGFNNSADVVNGQGGNDSLAGKSGNDLLRGEFGNDSLLGDAGNDRLVGGSGADRFVFGSGKKFKGSEFGVDAIADFKTLENDQIVLSKKSFRALTSSAGSSLTNSEFTTINASTNNSAATLAAKIIYNRGTGDLIYNENGAASSFGNGGRFATLTNRPALNSTNFLIQP